MADPEATGPIGPDPDAIIRSRQFVAVLVIAAVIGVIVSLAAWLFLEAIHYIQQWTFTDLPQDLGFDSTPEWWYLPVLAIAGVLTAAAIVRLHGIGGHIPAYGLNAKPTQPVDLPGVTLAGLASVGLGLVVGPEAPLLAIGGALGFLLVRRLRSDAPEALGTLIASSGTFAAFSFLFGSPLIAAVILIEAADLGGKRLPLVVIPGLVAAGIGSLVSIGLGSWAGVNQSDIALTLLPLAEFDRPDLSDFLWTLPFAAAIAVVMVVIFSAARRLVGIAQKRAFIVLPLVGLAVAGLGIGFAEAANHGVEYVLFSGQDQLNPLVSQAGTWTVGALVLLVAVKGLAYSLSLGSFRGGPVFPAMFLGAAGGLIAAQLPGFELTPAVAVGVGAAVTAVLRLPLAGVVLATVLASKGGLGTEPLIIIGVVVAYLVALALDRGDAGPAAGEDPAPAVASFPAPSHER